MSPAVTDAVTPEVKIVYDKVAVLLAPATTLQQ